ncbi:hypothetical protein Ancab_031732 [Ancistrocladus abbreviatus]
MAVAILGLSSRLHIPIRLPPVFSLRKVRISCAAALETVDDSEFLVKHSTDNRTPGDRKVPEWKKLSSKELGLRTSMIARSTRVVLNGLRKNGYEVYLVGGCVRDLILKRVPKDFDVITSAELKEVMRAFPRCEIIGRRFPICHVRVGDTIVEVSSFSTCQRKCNRDLSYPFGGHIDCDEKDYVRWRDCLQRDFTINGLIFDPFARVVYDYMGGLEDIKNAKVRTMIPASTSFQDDCARILRAIRIAARLGFRLARETAQSVKSLSISVLRLDKARLLMEMNYMLAYGSAEASLRLLWKFGLLEALLPIQAAYLVHGGFRRRDKRSNMLLALFSNLDKLVAPDKPCHSSLWVSILAFHKALVDRPRDPLVVATFGLVVHTGGDMSEAVGIARRISRPHDHSFPELLVPQDLDSTSLIQEVADLETSVKGALSKMTDEYVVSKAMAPYPRAPYSDLVFIPLGLQLRVCRIFECVRRGREKDFMPKQGSRIDYDMLAMGSLPEVRHTFARVIFDTVYPLGSSQDQTTTSS